MCTMRILILVGSGDTDSHSLHLGQAIAGSLQKLSAETELINLVEYGLPLYDRGVERAEAHDDKTRAFLDKSYAVDAFVWVTPIHHNSFSAIIKNALDWQHTKFPGKVVGMASHGGDRSPQAVDQLLFVARAQHLVSARVRVCTGNGDYDEHLNITNHDILSRIDDFCTELVQLTNKIKD